MPGEPPQGSWETVAAAARTLQGNPDSTLKPQRANLETNERSALAELVGLDATARLDERVRVHGTLGQGGMGIVHAAVQRSLDRQVAVKGLRADRVDPRSSMKLLQEAWITGRLEHPNIVPIYDVGLDAAEAPLIVLKRIEGSRWSDVMAEPDLSRGPGGQDALEWNLRVLLQVCNALAFAHSRQIVHLDLKPENVMLGAFGEVYLVDWGIAMSLDADADGRLPRVRDNRDIIGTPHYMAPEMLDPATRGLGHWTDIYLLGAVLHEILTGQPPHRGDSLMEVLHDAETRDPVLGPKHPAELAAICRRALARDPADRYASATEMRRALEAFLQHRESEALVDEALEQTSALRTLCAEGGDAADRRSDRHATFAAARFGFRQALGSWPDNPRARDGLGEVARLIVEYELDHGDPQTVASVASEIEELAPELRIRLDAALAEKREHLASLEQLGRDHDLDTGTRTRAFLAGVLGLLWVAAPLGAHYYWVGGGAETWEIYFGLPIFFLVVAGALGIWARESMTKTRVNRQIGALMLVMLAAQVVLTAGAYLAGMAMAHVVVMLFFLWFLTAAFLTIGIDRRCWPMILIYLAGFLLSAARPDWRFLLIAACNTGFLIDAVAVWTPWGNILNRRPA